jgi:chromosome segregation ATPase
MSEKLLNEILSEIKSIKGEIVNIKTTLDEHTQLLKALEHRTEENTAQINSIAENVEYLKGTQARQERILERLSLRSIEQETEIQFLNHKEREHEKEIFNIKKRLEIA